MAEEKFTPGPWETGGLSRLSIFSGAKHIAYTLWGYGAGEDAARKNANLISAAPDLYDALSDLVQYTHPDPGQEELFDAARASLAKARGEAV